MSHYLDTKKGWAKIGDRSFHFKSGWEKSYALFLEWSITHGDVASWDYEPQTFWFEGIKRGVVSYKPDFKVTLKNGNSHWIEIKGYMDSKSKTKIKRFAKYFPAEKLIVVDGKFFNNKDTKILFAHIENYFSKPMPVFNEQNNKPSV